MNFSLKKRGILLGIMALVFISTTAYKNDYFEIKDPELLIAEIDIMVFNRLGQKVFSSTDLDLKWNGFFKGSLQPSSVFDYYLQAKCTIVNQSFNSKGNIIVIINACSSTRTTTKCSYIC